MTQQTISLIRVLQYTGDADWVAATIARRAIKGSHTVHSGGTIREALLGDPFELISSPAPAASPTALAFVPRSSSSTAANYEELRTLLDGGGESATHEDAVSEIRRLQALDGPNNGKPSWDQWVNNEHAALDFKLATKALSVEEHSRLVDLLERVREFANMP